VTGEVVGFNWCTDRVGSGAGVVEQRDRLNRVHVRTAAGHVHPMQFGVFLDAAGAESRRIARLAGIGVGEKSLAIDLPIMSRSVTDRVISASPWGLTSISLNLPQYSGAFSALTLLVERQEGHLACKTRTQQ